MRLKQSARASEEEQDLLKNQRVNRHYEEKLTTLWSSRRSETRAQRGCFKKTGYSAPPVADISTPDDDEEAEEDSLSDLEYNETSPLLLEGATSDEDSSSDLNNNPDEGDSLLSDSDMSFKEDSTIATTNQCCPLPEENDNYLTTTKNNNNNNSKNRRCKEQTDPMKILLLMKKCPDVIQQEEEMAVTPASSDSDVNMADSLMMGDESSARDGEEEEEKEAIQCLLSSKDEKLNFFEPKILNTSDFLSEVVPCSPTELNPEDDHKVQVEETQESSADDPPKASAGADEMTLGFSELLRILDNPPPKPEELRSDQSLSNQIKRDVNVKWVTKLSYEADKETVNASTSSSSSPPELFDVYNIETAMPTIDWEAMEAHLTQAAKENDWLTRRRNDREEIRKKLAMDSDSEDYYCGERVTRKPSLTTRLQSGMNLQICFMNETASDPESVGSDSENGNPKEKSDEQRISSVFQENLESDSNQQERQTQDISTKELQKANNGTNGVESGQMSKRPSFFFNRRRSWRQKKVTNEGGENKQTTPADPPLQEDFLTRHTRLQAEARHALAQAKEMARMQMEVERQRKKKSPIADIVGLPFPDGRYRLSRHMMSDMNVAQLQVIVNDMHSQIESLNEDLVRLLLERDDLHMEQDSMLVDIEDLTRYLRAKDEAFRGQLPLEVKK